MHQIMRSTKAVKSLETLIGQKQFLFPKNLANDVDEQTGKSSIMVCINSHKTFVPVGEITPLKYETFCVLRDAGIVNPHENYEAEKGFDPFKQF